MKPFDWYLNEYGEDWALIVYQEDERQEKIDKQVSYLTKKILEKSRTDRAKYMSDGINQ